MKLLSLRSAAVALTALALSATAFAADDDSDYMKPGKGITVQPIARAFSDTRWRKTSSTRRCVISGMT